MHIQTQSLHQLDQIGACCQQTAASANFECIFAAEPSRQRRHGNPDLPIQHDLTTLDAPTGYFDSVIIQL
jgi:hypothetical protein